MSTHRIVECTQSVMRHSFRKATDSRHDGGTWGDRRSGKSIVGRRRRRGLLGLSSRFSGLGHFFKSSDAGFLGAGQIGVLVGDKGRKVHDCLVLVKTEIVVEQEEKLLFHEVYLGEIEQGGISRPVLVFGGRVVEVFCSNNQGCQEDTVSRARHACKRSIRTSGRRSVARTLGHGRQL